jgi:hypothetical protein
MQLVGQHCLVAWSALVLPQLINYAQFKWIENTIEMTYSLPIKQPSHEGQTPEHPSPRIITSLPPWKKRKEKKNKTKQNKTKQNKKQQTKRRAPHGFLPARPATFVELYNQQAIPGEWKPSVDQSSAI